MCYFKAKGNFDANQKHKREETKFNAKFGDVTDRQIKEKGVVCFGN